MLDRVIDALARVSIRAPNEKALQDAIELLLRDAGLPVEREVQLGDVGRIDFMVGACGVELKVDGSDTTLIRQLHRYAAHPRIESLILVTTRARHVRIATVDLGVPFRIHYAGSM